MLLPSLVAPYEQSTRAKLIPRQLADAGLYDVICINEGFDDESREILISGLKSVGYPYVSPVVNGSGGLTNGGVFIASRHEFDQIDHTVYPDAVGDDILACKGAQFVRLCKDDFVIYLAVTHLQASRGGKERHVREGQLIRLSAKLNDFANNARSEGALVIIAGDMNICAENDAEECQAMMATLRSALVAPRPQKEWTSDPKENNLCMYRYAESPREWLDYILVCDRGVPVESASLTVVKPKDSYTLNGKDMRDLSDHYALHAQITARTDLARGPNPQDTENLI